MDLALELSRFVDKLRDGIVEPNWLPLEALLPVEECAGFMFMGGAHAKVMCDGYAKRGIWSYKHGITRRYLHIGDDLRVYTYRGDLCPLGDPWYQRANTEWAIKCAFDGIDRLGATRTTAYNDDFIAERNARLVAAGFTVVG